MATTATNVIAKFRRTFPDCSTTDAALLLDDVLKGIYSRLPARNTSVDISLTDGTQEYDYNVDITRTQSVLFKETSDPSTWVRLEATNVDELNLKNPSWRSDDTEGSPTKYYVTSAVSSDTAKPVIGFLPIPDTTTSGGYPKVTAFVTQWASLTSSETMPSNFIDDHVIVFGMCYYWAIRSGRDVNEIGKWNKLYENELGRTEVHMRNLNENEDPMEIYSPIHTLTPRI